MKCLMVNSIRNIISLQWNLKVKDILPDLSSEDNDNPFEVPEKIIGSIQCRIKGIDGLTFSLKLTSQLNMLVKGRSRLSYQIIYAFAIVNDRAFLVKKSDKLKFLDILKRDHLDSVEKVAFHCLVLVGPPVSNSTSAVPDLVDNNEGLPTEGQVCADVEDIEHPDLADKNEELPTEEQVNADVEGVEHLRCKFDGEIPEFTVHNAKELITNESTNIVLKVLAMEYLMKNIKVDNVSDILKIAVDQDLKVLMKQCSEFLSECIIRHCKVSSKDSASSLSDFEYDN